MGFICRLLFKVIAVPFVCVLTVVCLFCTFVLAVSGAILSVVSVFVFICSVLMMVLVPNVWGGLAWMVVAFLISPLGLPKLAEWLIEKLDDINCVLKDFIIG